jgi:hypothetical protein
MNQFQSFFMVFTSPDARDGRMTLPLSYSATSVF